MPSLNYFELKRDQGTGSGVITTLCYVIPTFNLAYLLLVPKVPQYLVLSNPGHLCIDAAATFRH